MDTDELRDFLDNLDNPELLKQANVKVPVFTNKEVEPKSIVKKEDVSPSNNSERNIEKVSSSKIVSNSINNTIVNREERVEETKPTPKSTPKLSGDTDREVAPKRVVPVKEEVAPKRSVIVKDTPLSAVKRVEVKKEPIVKNTPVSAPLQEDSEENDYVENNAPREKKKKVVFNKSNNVKDNSFSKRRVSLSIPENVYLLMNLYCNRMNITINDYVSSLINKDVEKNRDLLKTYMFGVFE